MRRFLFAAAMFVAAAGQCFAMDFTQTIKTFDGKEFTDATGNPMPQKLGEVIENSLLSAPAGTSEDEKNKRFWLALRMHDHQADFTPSAEDVVLMKKALAIQPLAIMGQAIRIIDPAWVPKQ